MVVSGTSRSRARAQVCFPPLLGLELQSRPDGKPAKRTEGAVVVVELRPCVGRGKAAQRAPELASRLASLTWVPRLGAIASSDRGEAGGAEAGGADGADGADADGSGCCEWRRCGRVRSRRHAGALVYLSTPVLVTVAVVSLTLPAATAASVWIANGSVGVASLVVACIDVLWLIALLIGLWLIPRAIAAPPKPDQTSSLAPVEPVSPPRRRAPPGSPKAKETRSRQRTRLVGGVRTRVEDSPQKPTRGMVRYAADNVAALQSSLMKRLGGKRPKKVQPLPVEATPNRPTSSAEHESAAKAHASEGILAAAEAPVAEDVEAAAEKQESLAEQSASRSVNSGAPSVANKTTVASRAGRWKPNE